MELDQLKVGNFLRSARKDKNARLEDLADELLSASTISNIERGHDHVQLERIEHLAEKFGYTLEQTMSLSEKDVSESKTKKSLLNIEKKVDRIDPELSLERLRNLNISSNDSLNALVYYLKGRCYFLSKKFDLAAKYFQKSVHVVNTTPDLEITNIKPASYNGLGRTTYFQNNLVEALILTENGIESFVPEGERLHTIHYLMICKAIYLEKLHRKDESLRTLEELWKEKDHIESLEVLLNMFELHARLLGRSKLYEEAISYATRGIDLAMLNKMDDRSVELYTTLGSIYTLIDELEEAEQSLLSALELNLSGEKEYLLISTYTQLGRLYLKQGKWSSAEDTLNKAINIGKKQESYDALRICQEMSNLGDCYFKQNSFDQGIKVYEKALVQVQKHSLKNEERKLLLRLCPYWKRRDIKKYQKFVDRLLIVDLELEKNFLDEILILGGDKINDEIMSFH